MFPYAGLLEDFLCNDLQPKNYRRVQQKLQVFLGDGKPEDSYYWKGPSYETAGRRVCVEIVYD